MGPAVAGEHRHDPAGGGGVSIGVWLRDGKGTLTDEGRRKTIHDFSSGALTRRSFRELAPDADVAGVRGGRRLIATTIDSHARSITDFEFGPGDVIVLGNEYDGLPDEFVREADVGLHIPMPAETMPKVRSHSPIDPGRTTGVAREGLPSLNVAITAGIVCSAAYASWMSGRRAAVVE